MNDKETTTTSGLSVQVEQDQHPAITEIQGATQLLRPATLRRTLHQTNEIIPVLNLIV